MKGCSDRRLLSPNGCFKFLSSHFQGKKHSRRQRCFGGVEGVPRFLLEKRCRRAGATCNSSFFILPCLLRRGLQAGAGSQLELGGLGRFEQGRHRTAPLAEVCGLVQYSPRGRRKSICSFGGSFCLQGVFEGYRSFPSFFSAPEVIGRVGQSLLDPPYLDYRVLFTHRPTPLLVIYQEARTPSS